MSLHPPSHGRRATGIRARRDFAGRRWLAVVLRGLHLVTVVQLAIAIFGQAGAAGTHLPGMAVLGSGLLVWALDIWIKPEHLRQWAGLSMFIKLAAIAAMVLLPSLQATLFWLVVVWSAVFSHAPATFRNAPIRPGPQPPNDFTGGADQEP
jgi:hypothetical protein